MEGAGGGVRLQAPALAQLLAPQIASNIGPMGSASQVANIYMAIYILNLV